MIIVVVLVVLVCPRLVICTYNSTYNSTEVSKFCIIVLYLYLNYIYRTFFNALVGSPLDMLNMLPYSASAEVYELW